MDAGSVTENQGAAVRVALIDAALALAAERPWHAVRLSDIALRAGLDLSALVRAFPSKPALLCGFGRLIDERMVATRPDPADRPRDRLFEIMMARFDCLRPYRQGLVGLTQDVRRLNADGLAASFNLPRTIVLMLDAAGIQSSGISGVVRQKLVGLVYVKTLSTFLKDETDDLTRTMAALDRALRQFEPLLRLKSIDHATDGSGLAGDSTQS